MRGTISFLTSSVTLVSFVFANLSPVVARADVVCDASNALSAPVTPNPDPRSVQLDLIISELKARNLKSLLEGYSTDQYKIEFAAPKADHKPVEARINKRFKSVLVIRSLDVNSPEQRELALWHVAEALYHLELATSLRRVGNRPSGAVGWRDARLNRISILQGELYRLLTTLPILKLNPSKVLKPIDPAQNLSARVVSIWRDPVKLISVSQADWEIYNTPGLGMSAINQKNTARYSALLLRVYWTIRLIRTLLAAGLIVTIAAGYEIKEMLIVQPDAVMITDEEFAKIENQIATGHASANDVEAFLKRLKIVKDEAENKIFASDTVEKVDRLQAHQNELQRLLQESPVQKP